MSRGEHVSTLLPEMIDDGHAHSVTAVEAAREFRVIAESDLGEDTMASPAVAGGDLFIRTQGHLYRIGDMKKVGK